MAVVLTTDENSYFSSGSLRRSHSQPKLLSPGSFAKSPSSSKLNEQFGQHPRAPDASPSSAPSSPTDTHADSNAPSYASTPETNISLPPNCDDDNDDQVIDDQILFPSYDDATYYEQVEDLEAPTSPRTGDSYTVSPTSNSTSANISRPESPEPVEHAEDDTAIRTQPSRHVDYLSHNWKEEDIWSSWKLIVSQKGHYSNSARLENASWRTWMKSKNKLKTVSPETLNWLKDCDVTWLYGPLQTGIEKPLYKDSKSTPSSSRLSKSGSFIRKPILKKRSMSEIMLQRSISAASLLKQATAAVQAQQKEIGRRRHSHRPTYDRAASDYITFPFSSRGFSRDSRDESAIPSISSSGVTSPGGGEKKHIHFNEQVEQCIAVEVKGEDDDDYLDDEEMGYGDSDSDDGAIMMKKSSKRRMPSARKRGNKNSTLPTESKTIAMLPSTTLKYREDTPEPPETAMKHSSRGFWYGSRLSPSPSQETLRPSKSSGMLLGGDDDEDEEDDESTTRWQSPTLSSRSDSNSTIQGTLQRSESSSSLTAEPAGMRRTASGMFMPYEDEDDVVSEGLFGKVIDTVNTARDIAHVIWNVGWRR